VVQDQAAIQDAPSALTLNAAAIEIVTNLIGRAAMAFWNTEEIFRVANLEVGHAPSANLTPEFRIAALSGGYA
jgi:hypothetical protein